MKMIVSLYIISIILAIIGFPALLFLVYLDMIDSGLTLKFFWAASIACCILSILSFSLGHILAMWQEEDRQE